jgi:ureidoglycolate hydrolase
MTKHDEARSELKVLNDKVNPNCFQNEWGTLDNYINEMEQVEQKNQKYEKLIKLMRGNPIEAYAALHRLSKEVVKNET